MRLADEKGEEDKEEEYQRMLMIDVNRSQLDRSFLMSSTSLIEPLTMNVRSGRAARHRSNIRGGGSLINLVDVSSSGFGALLHCIENAN